MTDTDSCSLTLLFALTSCNLDTDDSRRGGKGQGRRQPAPIRKQDSFSSIKEK